MEQVTSAQELTIGRPGPPITAPTIPMLTQALLVTLAVHATVGAMMPQDASSKAAPSISLTVLDARTNAPVRAAMVQRVHEALFPTWGTYEPTGIATSDDAGRVSMAASGGAWWIIKADGFAVRGVLSPRDGQTVELKPEVPITIEIVDFTGTPMPLVHLGVCVGCGHTPDVISATTGPDGRATIRGAGPNGGIVDLYPVHPDLLRDDYGGIPFDEMDEAGVATVRVLPGSKLEGRVLFPDGSPAVGVGVGLPKRHRGPWTRTNEDGDFTLFGLPTHPDYLEVRSATNEILGYFAGSRQGCRRTLTIHGPTRGTSRELDLESTRFEERPTGHVLVTAQLADGRAAVGVPVEAWDPDTGWCVRGLTDAEGQVSLLVHANRDLRVEAGGPESAYPTFDLGRIRIDEAGSSESIGVEFPAPRKVSIRLLGLEKYDSIHLVRADGSRLLLAEDAIDGLEPGRDDHEVTVDGVTLPVGRWAVACVHSDRRNNYRGLQLPSSTRDLGDRVEVDFRTESATAGR